MMLAAATALLSNIASARAEGTITSEAEALVVRLFHTEGRSLVRLARLFVDDRNAAEDLVQEAFLRLARHAHRINDEDRAPAYLRSIVLNLARDHNRRGLVSLRHHLPASADQIDGEHAVGGPVTPPDQLVRLEAHQVVIDAVRALPVRQRDCITLRYFEELDIQGIADTLGVTTNSVKTHLQRGLSNLQRHLSELGTRDEPA